MVRGNMKNIAHSFCSMNISKYSQHAQLSNEEHAKRGRYLLTTIVSNKQGYTLILLRDVEPKPGVFVLHGRVQWVDGTYATSLPRSVGLVHADHHAFSFANHDFRTTEMKTLIEIAETGSRVNTLQTKLRNTIGPHNCVMLQLLTRPKQAHHGVASASACIHPMPTEREIPTVLLFPSLHSKP